MWPVMRPFFADLDANGSDGTNAAGVQLGKLGGGYGDTNGTVPLGEPVRVPPICSVQTPFNLRGAPFKGWGNLDATTSPEDRSPVAGSYGGVGGRPEAVGGQAHIRYPGSLRQSLWGCRLDQPIRRLRRRGGNDRQGGSGAGAIKIVSTGTLTIGGDIWACGGKWRSPFQRSPSKRRIWFGGSIYLKAANLVINSGVQIQANGGRGLPESTAETTLPRMVAEPVLRRAEEAGSMSRLHHIPRQQRKLHQCERFATGGQSQAASGTPRHGTDGSVKILRPQGVSELVFTSGSPTIDTTLGTILHSDGSFMAGTLVDKTYTFDGANYPYKICVFTADRINIGSNVIVNLQGANALSPRTRNHGDLNIGASCLPMAKMPCEPTSNAGIGGIAKLGGWNGADHDGNGNGPGGGQSKVDNNDERVPDTKTTAPPRAGVIPLTDKHTVMFI